MLFSAKNYRCQILSFFQENYIKQQVSQKKNGSAFSLKIFINSAFLRVRVPSVFQIPERTRENGSDYHYQSAADT